MYVRPCLRPAPLLTLMLAAGCGGGGAGSQGIAVPDGVRSESASAGSDVSTTNYQDFAAPLVPLVLSAGGDSVIGNAFGRQRESPAGLARHPPNSTGLAGWVAHAVSLGAASLGRERAEASNSTMQACAISGSLTVSASDADGNARLSAGDSISIVATDCVLELNRPPASGGFALTLNAVELDADQTPTALDASGSFSGFASGSVASLVGSFRLRIKPESATSDRLRLSFDNVTSTVAGQSVTYNADVYGVVSDSGGSYAIDGAVGIAGQTYKVTQGDVFSVLNGDAPHSGSLSLADAAGDSLRLTAKAGAVADFEFFPVGSAAPTAALLNQAWAGFAAGP